MIVEVLFIAGFVALIVVAAVFGHLAAKKRREAMLSLAARLGLRFDPGKDRDIARQYKFLDKLRVGDNRYAFNILSGNYHSHDVMAFDYHYETHSTDSKGHRTTHNHHFSAVIVATGLPLKPLAIRKEGFFDKIGEFLGFDDIDFESTEFSREFFVKSPDRRWAFDVIHQETMEFLLASPRFALEFQGSDAIAYRDRTFKPEDFDAALGVIEGVLQRLPESLLREMKG